MVTCPALPGLVTEGDMLEEARAMAAEAVCGYIEALAKDGRAIPVGDAPPDSPIDIHAEIIEVAIEAA